MNKRQVKFIVQWVTLLFCITALAVIIVSRSVESARHLETVDGTVEVIIEPDVVITEEFVPKEIEMTETELLARLVFGEARGCSKEQMAAVIWCVLNRVDAGYGSIYEVVTAKGQFSGWSVHNPVIPSIEELVIDVLYRYEMEKVCVGNVGRVLPKEYLWFTGNGEVNLYRKDYNDYNHMWDWSLPSPYED